MSVTLSNIITNFNSYIGDTSNDRITEAERFQYITEATAWLLEELGNEHMMSTYTLDFIDGVYYYKITDSLPDLLVGADLRSPVGSNSLSFIRKSPRELAEEIGQHRVTRSWAIERHDGDSYVVINHTTPAGKMQLATFDNLTSDGNSIWTADTVNSDAKDLVQDTIEFTQGSGSLRFTIDPNLEVATVYNSMNSTYDLKIHENVSSFVFDFYIPDATFIDSLTFYFGSDVGVTPATISNYYMSVQTTDINGNPFVNGWNKIRVDWSSATTVGTPNPSEIRYFQFDVDFSTGLVLANDFRLDNLYIAKPEKLTFHYVSAYIGVDNTGDEINTYTALTDVPFYSGEYDQYKYVVAHKAASLAFYSLRLREEALMEERIAIESLDRYRNNFESSKTRETKNFKAYGLNFRMRRARFNRR